MVKQQIPRLSRLNDVDVALRRWPARTARRYRTRWRVDAVATAAGYLGVTSPAQRHRPAEDAAAIPLDPASRVPPEDVVS